MVSAFNQGKLGFLVCTSTLIEDINTTAKNIVVLDDKIESRKYDLFTFKNIQGRSGRMFKHFVGCVFLFNPIPQDALPDIEIPVIWSAKQLTLLVWCSYNNASAHNLIAQQLEYAAKQKKSVDDVTLDVLTFQRRGLTFGFPRYLRVVDSIQRAVLGRRGVPTGDYSQFAAAAEGAFLPAPLAALDEYGLPVEVARKLGRLLLPPGASDNLDSVLDRLRRIPDDVADLVTFERELLCEAKEDL